MVAGFWVGFFSFSPPLSPLLDYSWPSTVPVCIRARTHPTGTLSGISKITIFTALTFLPSSIILTVLQKETSKTINSAYHSIWLYYYYYYYYWKKIIANLLRGYVLSLPHNQAFTAKLPSRPRQIDSSHSLIVESTNRSLLWKSNR